MRVRQMMDMGMDDVDLASRPPIRPSRPIISPISATRNRRSRNSPLDQAVKLLILADDIHGYGFPERHLKGLARILRSFFRRDDDAAHDDVLTEDENQECRDRGDNERRERHAHIRALLELVNMYHHRPHFRVLAYDEGQHKVAVGQGKGL